MILSLWPSIGSQSRCKAGEIGTLLLLMTRPIKLPHTSPKDRKRKEKKGESQKKPNIANTVLSRLVRPLTSFSGGTNQEGVLRDRMN